jgi:hypothetical protein
MQADVLLTCTEFRATRDAYLIAPIDPAAAWRAAEHVESCEACAMWLALEVIVVTHARISTRATQR